MILARTHFAQLRVGLCWSLALVALLAGATGVQANVTPPTKLLIHVQPWDWVPNHCDLPGVQSCSDVVQTTAAMGELLVVVYMDCGGLFPPGVIMSLDFTLEWGWSWGWYWWLGEIANCTDAQFSYEDLGNALTLHFDWPDHPYPEGFMPLCAFMTYAGGHDCIQIADDANIRWGFRSRWEEFPIPGKAETGVECEYACLRNCSNWDLNNVPQLTPEELRFEVPQGQEAEGLLQSVVSGHAGDCSFDATESWVALGVTQTSNHTHEVRVTVSTAGLAVGEYEARVRETCDARDCSRIYLTVTEPSQSIPDADALIPDGTMPKTWGGVKDLYRRR